MRTAALAYLSCPRCRGALIADTEKPAADQHVLAGELGCTCGGRYPIERGVPRLFVEERGGAPAGPSFDARPPHAEPWFLDRVAPLQPADFVGRTVLDAGCGAGRRAALVAGYGARAVVGLGTGRLVDDAFRNTRHLANVHIVEGDLRRLPVSRCFDVAMALGSLDRLPAPEEGFRALRSSVALDGLVLLWLRGRDDGELWLRLEALRQSLAERVSEPLLRWLTLGPSAALALFLPLFRLRLLAHRLPLGRLLHEVSRYSLADLHPLLVDHLRAPFLHHVHRNELKRWLATPDLEDARIVKHDELSLRASARVIGHADALPPASAQA